MKAINITKAEVMNRTGLIEQYLDVIKPYLSA